MSATPPEMTSTVGYFNPHGHPVLVVISEYNVSLQLGIAGNDRYVRDPLGRKINDPFFDRYRMLSKETSEAPVPLLRLGPPPTRDTAAVHDGQAVRQITEFALDQHGHRQPIMPKPKTTALPDPSLSPIRAMSVEEARKAGFIRRARVVPEEYGVPDSDGLPPSNIPEIKYARDTSRPDTPPAPLPAEAALIDARLAWDADARVNIQEQITAAQAKGDMDDDPELVNPINKVPSNVVTALPSADMPPPQLDAPAPKPAPKPVPPSKPPPQPLPPRKKYVCIADGRVFDFRSQLEMHVKRKFPDRYEEIMKGHPKEEISRRT